MFYPHPDDPRFKESPPPPYDPNLPYGTPPPYNPYNYPPYSYGPPPGYQPNYNGQASYGYGAQSVYQLPPAYQGPYGNLPYQPYFDPNFNYAPAMWMPKANFGQRLVAKIIDGILMGGIGLIMFFIAALLTGISNMAAGLTVVLTIIMLLGYEVYFTGRFGATPGKKVMDIKVVNGRGEVPGYGVALGRWLSQIFLSGQIMYLGYLWMLWDNQRQTWHDKIAGTYVVKKRT